MKSIPCFFASHLRTSILSPGLNSNISLLLKEVRSFSRVESIPAGAIKIEKIGKGFGMQEYPINCDKSISLS